MAELHFEGGDSRSRSHPPSDAHNDMPLSLIGDASVTTFGAATVSVATDTFERVDPRTLQLFQDLFPGEHGIQFLARLLRHAQIKQLALPQLGISTIADVAVISTQSLRVLARLMGLGYDTLEKYIVTLCQLKLVHKHRARRQIILHFPLTAPKLPEPEALDSLSEYRTKVALFAHQVKRRYLKLRASKKGDFFFARSSSSAEPLVLVPAASVAATTPLSSQILDMILEDFDQVLRGEPDVDSDTKSRLLAHMEDALRLRCARLESRLSSQKGDFFEEPEVTYAPPYEQESPFEDEKGGSYASQAHVLEAESRLSPRKGDFQEDAKTILPIRKRRLSHEKDDFQMENSSPFEDSQDSKRQLSSAKDDSDMVQIAPKGNSDAPKRPLFPEKDHPLSQKGHSDASSLADSLANVNVVTFFNKITLNVSAGSRFFCQTFGEKSNKQNIYKKVFDEIERDSQAILGAYLVTLAHLHDGSIKNPAGFFLACCKTFHRELSDEAQHLIARYGTLTYAQVRETLSHPQPPVFVPNSLVSPTGASAPTTNNPIRVGLSSHVSTGPRPPTVALRVSVRPGGGLAREAAVRLRNTISKDPRMLFINHVKFLALKDGSYAVWVCADEGNKVRQTVFYSEEEWLTRSATMSIGLQLFKQQQKGE